MSKYLYRVQVGAGDPLTLLDFVFKAWPHVKRKQAKLWLHFKALLVNDAGQSRHDHPLRPGDWVAVRAGKFAAPSTKLPSGVGIHYEDETLLVIEKPSGLLTIATDKGERQTAYFKMTGFLRDRGQNERIFIVHRLDRDTSGLLVLVKTSAAKRKLQEGWDRVRKRYFAIVEGAPKPTEGTLESHLDETQPKVFSTAPSRTARPAITHYKTVKSLGPYSLMEISLETGRRNQIRVQFSEAGHPVAGDEKYGAQSDPLRRLALHAGELRFPHPVTGVEMTFKSPIPGGFTGLVSGKGAAPLPPREEVTQTKPRFVHSEGRPKPGREARPESGRHPTGDDRRPQRRPAPSPRSESRAGTAPPRSDSASRSSHSSRSSAQPRTPGRPPRPESPGRPERRPRRFPGR